MLENAREQVKMALNISMVYTYYEVGLMIIEEEQHGEHRAEYGKAILKELSKRLTDKLGKGFSLENLKLMRRFYVVYSEDNSQIFASRYMAVLPSKEELQKLIKSEE